MINWSEAYISLIHDIIIMVGKEARREKYEGKTNQFFQIQFL